MPAHADATLPDRVVDVTLALADEIGWADVRLFQVADRLGVRLDVIGAHFRDLDAVANAWFARARDAMLAAPVDFAAPPDERLHAVIMSWFDALAPHREVAAEIIAGKLHASHPHHWVPLVFDLSRLMHWFLDAARIPSTGRRRALAEVTLTLAFLATLRVWLRDRSPDQLRARSYLRRRLRAVDPWLRELRRLQTL